VVARAAVGAVVAKRAGVELRAVPPVVADAVALASAHGAARAVDALGVAVVVAERRQRWRPRRAGGRRPRGGRRRRRRVGRGRGRRPRGQRRRFGRRRRRLRGGRRAGRAGRRRLQRRRGRARRLRRARRRRGRVARWSGRRWRRRRVWAVDVALAPALAAFVHRRVPHAHPDIGDAVRRLVEPLAKLLVGVRGAAALPLPVLVDKGAVERGRHQRRRGRLRRRARRWARRRGRRVWGRWRWRGRRQRPGAAEQNGRGNAKHFARRALRFGLSS